MSLLLVELEIKHNDQALLPAMNAEIGEGEVLTIMGRSGVGKSTILAAIAGSLPPDFRAEGDVILNGKSLMGLPMENRQVGILFQDPLLFPHLNVGQNLGFALPKSKRTNSAELRRTRIENALEEIGLSGFAQRDPATLSGGEAARVALQRALLASPHALLLDEPFSKLDQELRQEMRALTFNTIKARRIPAILVTHDDADAQAASGEIMRIS